MIHKNSHPLLAASIGRGTNLEPLPHECYPKATFRQKGNPAQFTSSALQDMQNDVVMEGGAFAASGAPVHCREQNNIENIKKLAAHCRSVGIPIIHVWLKVQNNGKGVTLNAPLFEDLISSNALQEGTWGSEPVPGLDAQPGDHIVRKFRMSAWEGSHLETILKAEGRDIIIETGAWTNMSIEHTARTGADKGCRARCRNPVAIPLGFGE